MKLLFVASECAPFIKTGGLADVMGALPKSLDADVRVLLPGYRALGELIATGREVLSWGDLFGGPARLVALEAEGIRLLVLDAAHLYDHDGGIYVDDAGQDWPNNHIRFAALSRVGAWIACGALPGWQPDLVHAHDWQAGLVPAYLAAEDGPRPPVVMTIHNIAFQGVFGAENMGVLGLDPSFFHPDGFEYYGKISFLKAGLALCDHITTVSPTYAQEILRPEFGMGLEGLLQARTGDLTGILNGIDLDAWDPEQDTALAAPYSARSLTRKAKSRAEVAEQFGLDAQAEGPLFCVISRLTQQKGLDVLLDCVPMLVEQGAQLAVLGTGEPELEQGFRNAAGRYPGAVGAVIGYDESLSHVMQGGSDAIVIPSRFEPCGLTQLYALRYGTIPVVARTGGLNDTVIDASDAGLVADCATGVQFFPVDSTALAQAIRRTCALHADKKTWAALQRRGMRHPVGWDRAAAQYSALYTQLIDGRGPNS